jgi:hypothetical protein
VSDFWYYAEGSETIGPVDYAVWIFGILPRAVSHAGDDRTRATFSALKDSFLYSVQAADRLAKQEPPTPLI